MRPTRLELEGFASFRDPAVVDFADAELFVLTGPTGAGKSSLIDAITFALYGSVPRYGRKGNVSPVVTQGRQEARVRLDFEVAGERYTAVRVVRRTKTGGATTVEARLEQGSEILAGGPDELTRQVDRLIGLPFEHFTRCVVLPQGEFARFLHDDPSERQGLLVKLLDLEIYSRMATAATQRAKGAEDRIKLAQERLGKDLAYATPEARDDARASIERFEAVAARIDRARPKLDELRQRAAALAEEERAAETLAKQLGGLAPPAGDRELARRVEVEQGAVRTATAAVEKARTDLATRVAARKQLPDPNPLREALLAHRQREDRAAQLEATSKRLAAARETTDAARKAVEKAKSATAAAERALETASRANLGAALAAKLAVGDTCPVCGVKVRKLPHAEAPKNLKKAQAALDAARRTQAQAEAKHGEGHAAAERLSGELAARQKEVDGLAKVLAKAPAPAVLEKTLAAIAAADRTAEEAGERREVADGELDDRRRRLERAQEAQSAAWERLDRARDALASLGPPPLDRRDLAVAWSELERWARAEAPNQRERAAAAGADARKTRGAIDEILGEIAAALLAAGLDARHGDPRAVCADALAGARETLRRIEAGIEEARRLGEEIARLQATARVARFLALHLGARNFESWVLNRVMRGLAAAASQRLLELSRQQYSFELGEKSREFLVVDHASAGEVRSARTLSGGETFLASLALALALSEHVSRLAARGAARLDALFLDEGFGALDADTLEVVAGAIEDLGARGHMVGIVTHVRELADRIPVQFLVTKDARTSRVEREPPADRADGLEARPAPPAGA